MVIRERLKIFCPCDVWVRVPPSALILEDSMENQEPTDEQINDYLVANPTESWTSAREKLREKLNRQK